MLVDCFQLLSIIINYEQLRPIVINHIQFRPAWIVLNSSEALPTPRAGGQDDFDDASDQICHDHDAYDVL